MSVISTAMAAVNSYALLDFADNFRVANPSRDVLRALMVAVGEDVGTKILEAYRKKFTALGKRDRDIEAALRLVLVLLRRLAVLHEDVLRVGVELVALVAVGRLA